MSNRILSKKIKSPLSLRGAFPHVIARERSNRSNPNHSGFSLIELMVAVVILAMAIFGIFLAFTTGFQGMADARDRTVATNYLQQTIEDFKNMDFNQVKSEPITPIPNTKFSRGTYVLNLEETEIDKVVTLKKVITQVRWVDRKGNIKTEKASTIIYNKPATSEAGDEAVELVLYAQSYYTILPEHEVALVAEIKDEHGNIFDWDGPITFSIITTPVNDPQVGNITTTQPSQAINGVANCIFTAIDGDNVEGTERIQAAATVGGKYLTDTVNIRVTTGPVGILLVPEPGEDKVPAGIGNLSNINLFVVKADYSTPIEYNGPITLSIDNESLGTLSPTTIPSVPTDGTAFTLISNGKAGIVEVTASALDLDMGYTEITFTGPPASILITPDKNSIYPGEKIGIKVTILDVNNLPVSFTGEVSLSALPNYGSFNDGSLNFTGQSSLDTIVFTANTDAAVGATITLQAISGSISGSTEILILNTLTPYYLSLFAFPLSVDLSAESSRTIIATVTDISKKTVTTYNTAINFFTTFGNLSISSLFPDDGEAEVILTSGGSPGTAIITASSGGLILTPEGGIEISFYSNADHIVLSADPYEIEADGYETSIITATICDAYGNRVANYGDDPDNPKTITLSLTEESEGIFINGLRTIVLDKFDEGMVTTSLSSTETGTAKITALSSDGLIDNGFNPYIVLTGDIPSILTLLGTITNWDDYHISFDLNVSGSPLYLEEIYIEWSDKNSKLEKIIIRSPYNEPDINFLTLVTHAASSPYSNNYIEYGQALALGKSTIDLHFSGTKIKGATILIKFNDNINYQLSFSVPN